MAVFEFGKFVSLVGRAISFIFGGGDQAAPISAAVATMPEPTKKKIYKDAKNKTFIGLANPTLNPPRMGMSATDYANSTITFDTTSYIDRALVSVENTGMASITINGFSIRGQQVVRLSGLNGLKWEYFNRRDIDTNGEKEFKVSSNFITNGSQCADIGDYIRKELEPHDMYSLTIKGIHPYFEVGDRYELVLDYKLPSMQFPTEQIAVDVEIRGVSIHRSVGSIGETMLSVRVPSGEWNNTTPTKARWIASGRMDQEQNRSNVLTIGAYDYAGTADIYCDGVSDNVQIQAAIDQLSLEGGGVLQFSRGSFISSTSIFLKTGVVMIGEGGGTSLFSTSSVSLSDIYIYNATNASVSRMVFDGSLVGKRAGAISCFGSSGITVSGVEVKDYHSSYNGSIWGMLVSGLVENCYVHDITQTLADYDAIGISGSDRVSYNVVDNISSTGGGSGRGYGFVGCNKMQQNKATNCSYAEYLACFADSSGAYPAADTANGGYNS